MSSLLKFVGGVALGTVIGAGAYLFATQETEEGLLHDLKLSLNQAIEEGKRTAGERRRQLELELGYSLTDDLPALQESV